MTLHERDGAAMVDYTIFSSSPLPLRYFYEVGRTLVL